MSVPRRAAIRERLIQEMAQLDDEASRRRFLSRHPSLLQPEVVAALAESVRQQVRVDMQAALRFADTAVAIADKLGNDELRAHSLRSKAHALYSLGQYPAASTLYNQATALFESTGKGSELARTLSSSIQALLLQGEYDRAFAAAERAREIFLRLEDSWRLARLEINVGNIYHRQDRFAQALAHYQSAYEELLRRQDAEGIAAVLSNLAVCQVSLNNFHGALANYQRAREFCLANGMPLLVAQADYNIAYLYYLRGEYSRAIEMLRSARVACKQVGDAYHGALCNLDLAEIYLELNLPEEAAALAQKARDGFQRLGMGYESGKAIAFAAIAAGQQGQAFGAVKLFAQARESFIREKNFVWPSLIDLYQALVLFTEGRIFEARRLCLAALNFFRSSRLPGKAAMAELLLARIALRTGEPVTAFGHCESALRQAAELDSPSLNYHANLQMGQAQAAAGKLEPAYASWQAARQALETLRSNLRGEELKIAFVKNRLEVYENLVEFCMQRGDDSAATEEAFVLIEQAKSRSLIELLLRPLRSTPAPEDGGQSELVRSMRNLRDELNWYYSLIEREQLRPEERSPERIAALEKRARARETDLLRLLQQASDSQTDEAGLQTPTHLPLSSIRAALSASTTLVEYFCVRDRYLACILGKEGLDILPITLEPRVGNLLRLLQFQMSKFRLGNEYVRSLHDSLVQFTRDHLSDLYKELVAPIRERLRTPHLVFVPHGLLHYVPFHALFDGERFLIDHFTVSYAPSASIYALCETSSAPAGECSLILGVPDTQAPSILEEVQALAAILPQPQLFIGAAATEEVLRKAGASSRIIHIATHGYFRQDNPLFSALRLGGSYLNLYDLYHLRLPAELVTLSGCATGLNVVAAGDELLGLVRGLLHAGARSLVLSLWDVHDSSSAQLMAAFYRLVQAGQAKAAALRGAMLEMRERYPHPYQWAPFILVGKA